VARCRASAFATRNTAQPTREAGIPGVYISLKYEPRVRRASPSRLLLADGESATERLVGDGW